MAKLETFYPIVATPKRAGYKEYLPSAALTGYIRCFGRQMIRISREII